MPHYVHTTGYRVRSENLILFINVFLVMLIAALSAVATFLTSLIFLVGALYLSYRSTKSYHKKAIEQSQPVNAQTLPILNQIAQLAAIGLQVPPVEIFVTNNPGLSAYAYGLSSPKDIVLYTPLLDTMDVDEIRFVVGHQMGHICLGHTWLNSLIGGLAGVPSAADAGYIWATAFRWWNRFCEYSADRAGLLVCGNPEKAISALIKLEAGPHPNNPADVQRALATIDLSQKFNIEQVNKLVAPHHFNVKRIQALRQFIASPQYAHLKNIVNQNIRLAQSAQLV